MSLPQSSNAEPAMDQTIYRLIAIGLITRLVIDSSAQIFFPFLPIIAAGVGTSVITFGRLLSIRSAMGLIAPLFGVWADRHGYRLMLRIGLLLGAVGYCLIGYSPNLTVTVIGLILAGIGGFSFTPVLGAYMSARLPFAYRSRGLGILEYAWALAGIVGLSLIGLLIEATNWRVPFFVIAALMLVAAIGYRWLPSTAAKREQRAANQPQRSPWAVLWHQLTDLGENWRSILAVAASGMFIMFGGLSLIINYGTWLAGDYGLTASGLGRVAFILGICDILGSGTVSMIGDRLGKRRSVLSGAILAVVGFAILPFFNRSLFLAVAGIFIARSIFEFAIVGNMILSSEQAPDRRAQVMTLSATGAMIGGTVATFLAPQIFDSWGVWGISTVGAISLLLAALVVWRGAKESA